MRPGQHAVMTPQPAPASMGYWVRRRREQREAAPGSVGVWSTSISDEATALTYAAADVLEQTP